MKEIQKRMEKKEGQGRGDDRENIYSDEEEEQGEAWKKNKKRGEKERKRGPRWLKNITHRHKDTIKRGDTRGDGRELRRK